MMATTADKIQDDAIAALKGHDPLKVSTLRMAKAAIHLKEIVKKAPLDEADVQTILSIMVKQRRDSFDQFTAGNRPELAEKEAAEIDILTAYMPREISSEELKTHVAGTINSMAINLLRTITVKDMGLVMKTCQAWLAENNLRADGRALSTLVKGFLA
jgi:uncharacterized protein YqeY